MLCLQRPIAGNRLAAECGRRIASQARLVTAKAKPAKPIKLYYVGTPNGMKALWTCIEMDLPVDYYKIDFSKKEQKEPWFLKINPNGRIPAIVDPNEGDKAVFESGAIMMYLAEKYGGTDIFPQSLGPKYEVMQWLMFQMGGVGPMIGQAFHHLSSSAPKEELAYGQKRYVNESKRLVEVIEMGLEGKEYLAADRLTIADMATAPWIAGVPGLGIDLNEYPRALAWVRRTLLDTESGKKSMEVAGTTERYMGLIATDNNVKEKANEAKAKYAFTE